MLRRLGRLALPRLARASSSLAPLDLALDAAQRRPRRTASPALKALSAAVAPLDRPAPAQLTDERLLAEREAELDGLYALLTQPLPALPTRAEREEAFLRIDTSPAAFWARHPVRTAERYALLVRALAVQGELEAARAAFDEIEGATGAPPPLECYAALTHACARAGRPDLAEEAIVRAMGDGHRPTAPLFTDLIGAHLEAGDGPDAAKAVLEIMRHHNVTEDAPTHTAIIQARAQLGAIRRNSGAILFIPAQFRARL